MKPSIMAALKATIEESDPGFTTKEMTKAWGYKNRSAALRRINDAVERGIFERAGWTNEIDSIGRPIRVPTYRVVEKTEPVVKKK